MDFVDAARASGASTLSILFHHVLVNAVSPVLVYASTPGLGFDPAGVGSFVPRPRRVAADAGLGPDALNTAPGDLRAAAGLRACPASRS